MFVMLFFYLGKTYNQPFLGIFHRDQKSWDLHKKSQEIADHMFFARIKKITSRTFIIAGALIVILSQVYVKCGSGNKLNNICPYLWGWCKNGLKNDKVWRWCCPTSANRFQCGHKTKISDAYKLFCQSWKGKFVKFYHKFFCQHSYDQVGVLI